jgi:PAS domain S-box-containing protein
MEKIKILLTEDENILALNMKKLLDRLGYDVCGTAASGEQAVEMAKTHKPDLIMMDIHLRGKMDGIETAERIRSFLDVPIVYTTAYSDEETLQRAKKTEPSAFLLKPFQIKDLQVTIEMAHSKYAAEKKIREQKKRFSTILRNIGDGVITIDEGGTVTYCNAVAEQLTGLSAAEAEGRPSDEVMRLFTEDTGIPVSASNLAANPLAACPHDHSRFFLMNSRRGMIPIESRIDLLKDENDRVIGRVFVMRDESEKKRAEEEKQKMQKILAQSQKMEALGRFAGNIAHDFNNFLAVIKGFAEIQEREYSLRGLETGRSNRILDAVEKAEALVQNLLLFSRNRTVPRERLDVNDAVKNMMVLIKCVLSTRIAISNEPDPRGPFISADPVQFEQVMMNLALNARDAMPGSGRLTVRTGSVRLGENELRDFPSAKPGEYVCLSVADTGRGMDSEVLQNAFQPFFTTRENGTGLGLFVVYGIVQGHGGAIKIESVPEKGTVVNVYFPAEPPRVPPKANERFAPSAMKPTEAGVCRN